MFKKNKSEVLCGHFKESLAAQKKKCNPLLEKTTLVVFEEEKSAFHCTLGCYVVEKKCCDLQC